MLIKQLIPFIFLILSITLTGFNVQAEHPAYKVNPVVSHPEVWKNRVLAENPISPLDTAINIKYAGKRLIWAEEFNADGAPNPSNWVYDLGNGSWGWGNNELENYTSRPENVIVQGGLLKIRAARETYKGSAFTSARIKSQNKFEFKYGRVDVSAKLPKGAGTWPAIWMLGSNIGKVDWPACGEIDIMEHKGSELNKIYGTLHYPGRSGGNADEGTRTISDATTAFHTYSLDWSDKFICIYVDDQLVNKVANSETSSFNHNFFLILNLAMGGTFGGPVDSEFNEATLEVDYIRVYQ